MWCFVNASDTFGNTAMHMAVIHCRKGVVDWLMTTKEGRDSLNVLNFDGFTPLTLAARHGYVEMFHHILYTHMSKVAWKYGKVSSKYQCPYARAREQQRVSVLCACSHCAYTLM